MPFPFNLARTQGGNLEITVQPGEALFILGANGTGKSSLMLNIYRANRDNAHRISAHRQTWFNSDTIELSARQKEVTDQQIFNLDNSAEARWHESMPQQRPNISIYNLLDAVNIRSREISEAVDMENMVRAKELAQKPSPLKTINDLLQSSGIPIHLSIIGNNKIIASKSGCTPYSIAELSDGERNALLVAADILTIPQGALVLIDEPERHLHRSIISPFLTQLFAIRPDCAFIVSTHEVMLPIDNSISRTLLVRNCTYSGKNVSSWDADLVPSESEITDDLRRDILGGRRKVLFIEGTEQSLDKPLYSLVFPGVSVIAKSGCRDVEHAVKAIRSTSALHWVDVFGVIDNDGRANEIEELKAAKIYALPVFSVEAIYFHPEIQRRIAERQQAMAGHNATEILQAATAASLDAVRQHLRRLSERIAEKAIRAEVFAHLPTSDVISAAKPIMINIDVQAAVAVEEKRLTAALNAGDLLQILSRYPLRETPALNLIADRLRFKNRADYQNAVRKLLVDDPEAMAFVKSLFGTLAKELAS